MTLTSRDDDVTAAAADTTAAAASPLISQQQDSKKPQFGKTSETSPINSWTPTGCHMGTAIKHPAPDRDPSFVTFDIRALGRTWLSVRVPGGQKLQMTAYPGLAQDASSS